MSTPASIKDLLAAGVSVWLDDLSRVALLDGSFQRLVRERGVTGVTSNPTILHRAITSTPELYEPDLRAAGRVAPSAALQRMVTADVRAAADRLLPVYRETGGREGWVSVEVDPRLAHDAEATHMDAQELAAAVSARNVMIKIPATTESLPAISECLAGGMSVNVTLIFGTSRYREVLDAWLDGIERAHEAGHDVSAIASVASFFVSRIDTAVDAVLDANDRLAARPNLPGEAAIAVAHLALREHEQFMRSGRWHRMERAGARPQRLLWASTSTKNPAYDDTRYVRELVAHDTVNTMSPATLAAFADHGQVPTSELPNRFAAAERLVAALTAAGVDLEHVARRLEADGVAAFDSSWTALLETVAARQAAIAEPAAAGDGRQS